jgi:FAD/FMN-containing dehydrogenase
MDATALQGLREHHTGRVLVPADDGYDDARSVFNAMIDVRPAVIAQCRDAADVREALRFARASGLPVAVRSGGHSVAGMSTVEDGLVVDVRAMKEIRVDPAGRTVRCGAGVTWGELDAATQEHGLATTGGRVSTTGVAGFTLGGGSGWLERKLGLACDNLLAADLVTAAGDVVRASASENPELLWALRGGGGNFGVATSFELALHPIGPTLLAGLMLWPAERGREVMTLMRDSIATAPDELALAGIYVTGPPEPFVPTELQGTLCCGIAALWAGERMEDGEPHVEPFRRLGPAVDLVGPIPYVQFQSMIDDPPGMRNYWTADYLGDLPDAAIDAYIENSETMPVGTACQSILFPWGGAVARASAADTPMAKRDAAWVAHPFAVWDDASRDEEHIAWARRISGALKPFATGGVYLNFIGDEGGDRVRAAFGGAYDRLAEVKAAFDPDNVFRGNQNIVPAAAIGR